MYFPSDVKEDPAMPCIYERLPLTTLPALHDGHINVLRRSLGLVGAM